MAGVGRTVRGRLAGISSTKDCADRWIRRGDVNRGRHVPRSFRSDPPDLGSSSVPIDEGVEGADAALLMTAHPGIDYGVLASRVPLFIDFRVATRGIQAESLVRLSLTAELAAPEQPPPPWLLDDLGGRW
jgi:hypothetical protein